MAFFLFSLCRFFVLYFLFKVIFIFSLLFDSFVESRCFSVVFLRTPLSVSSPVLAMGYSLLPYTWLNCSFNASAFNASSLTIDPPTCKSPMPWLSFLSFEMKVQNDFGLSVMLVVVRNWLIWDTLAERSCLMYICLMSQNSRQSSWVLVSLFIVQSLFYITRRAVASRSRQLETEWRVANYSRIGAYRTCTSGKDFPCEICAQNSESAGWWSVWYRRGIAPHVEREYEVGHWSSHVVDCEGRTAWMCRIGMWPADSGWSSTWLDWLRHSLASHCHSCLIQQLLTDRPTDNIWWICSLISCNTRS